MGLCSRVLDDLHQDTAGGLGMKEGNARPVGTGLRRLVDQLNALSRQVGQGYCTVIHAPGEVVQTRTPAIQEAADWRLGTCGFDQLDPLYQPLP